MATEVTIRFEKNDDADEFLARWEHRQIATRSSIVGEKADLETTELPKPPSYHDLFITTKDIKRTSIGLLPYGFEVTCCRVGSWRLWDNNRRQPGGPSVGGRNPLLVAGEFDGRSKGLRLDVGGHVIVDSLTKKEKT